MLTPEAKEKIDKIRQMMKSRKIEGYWYSDHAPEYPMPISDVLTEEQSAEIYNLIIIKQLSAREARFKGLSRSRVDGSLLGCVEYQTTDWVWPGDFAPHYVLKYRVKPTDEFLSYIGYRY